jgi:hypothetical protein
MTEGLYRRGLTKGPQAKPVRTLRVRLRLSNGMDLEKEWGPGQILPEGLRGLIQPPTWLLHPQRRELEDNLTILEGNVLSGSESEAAHWMGLE